MGKEGNLYLCYSFGPGRWEVHEMEKNEGQGWWAPGQIYWLATLLKAEGLKPDDLWAPLQLKPFYDSMIFRAKYWSESNLIIPGCRAE